MNLPVVSNVLGGDLNIALTCDDDDHLVADVRLDDLIIGMVIGENVEMTDSTLFNSKDSSATLHGIGGVLRTVREDHVGAVVLEIEPRRHQSGGRDQNVHGVVAVVKRIHRRLSISHLVSGFNPHDIVFKIHQKPLNPPLRKRAVEEDYDLARFHDADMIHEMSEVSKFHGIDRGDSSERDTIERNRIVRQGTCHLEVVVSASVSGVGGSFFNGSDNCKVLFDACSI